MMMYKAFGIINTTVNHIHVEGLQDYRPIGAFSYLGRYRVVDFPISNMSNSGIDRIQVYVRNNPRSMVEHIGTGRHYNINSKSGRMQILFAKDNENSIYNTDIAAFYENLESIEMMHHSYVVIAPSNMVYTMDYDEFIQQHIESGADISLLYQSVDNANEAFLNCDFLNLNKQKGVLEIAKNRGTAKNRTIFLETYVMKKDLFVQLIKEAKATSSMFTLAQIVNRKCDVLDVRGYAHRGFVAAIADFKSYYNANMAMIDIKNAQKFFDPDWPIYTRTNDSSPTQYYNSAQVKSSVISNGCHIEGTVENSVIGRGCTIMKGAVVRNSVVLAQAVIGENAVIENQVIDKWVTVSDGCEIVAPADKPGYIHRRDVL